MALNDAKVKAAKPRDAAYKLTDGGQLFLHVTPAGGKHWRMNYTFGTNATGKPAQKTYTIGRYPIVSLGEAREARDAAKRLLAAGRDPSLEKKLTTKRRRDDVDNTFRAVTNRWFELKSGWSLDKLDAWAAAHDGKWSLRDVDRWSDPRVRIWSPVHCADVLRSLRNDAFPMLGSVPIADINAPRVLETLQLVEARGSIESAHRLRQRISDVFLYGISVELCTSNPAASLSRALKKKPRAKKQPSIIDRLRSHDERVKAIRDLLVACEGERCRATTKFALRLLALTAVRPGEVAHARWSEFEDLDGAEPLWRIPAARMKGDADRKDELDGDHLVPLSRQAVEVLTALRPLTDRYELLFPSDRHSHRPISENTIRALLIRAGYYQRHVPHGFRAAFSTTMNEWVKKNGEADDRAVIDLMLAHVPEGTSGSEGSYNRAGYMDRRRELAQAYADMIVEGMLSPDAHLGQPIRWAASGPGRPIETLVANEAA